MAVVYPNANDNWSTVGNWLSGGAPYGQIPQAGDTVCLNGKTVVVDMEINLGIGTITTVATSPAVAGGKLTLTVANNIVANLRSGSTDVLESSLITGTAVIIGNCTNTGRNVITNSGSGNLQVLGNVYAGAINYYGINNSSTGNVEVIGNVYGSLSSTGAGINNSASGNNILVTGNVYGGFGYGIVTSTTCTVKITGIATISPTGTRSAVYMSSINSLFIIDGLLINVGNVNAVHVPCIKVSSTTDTTWTVAKETGGTSVLSNNVTDISLPAENDTRKDTTYGTVGQFTGTLAVPPPESVALNVPTDNTTGTMQITPPDIQAACESALTAYGAAKTTDLSSIDIQTGLTAYGAAKTTDLSGLSTLTASQVWAELLTGILTSGSIGKLIKDYLDVAVSTRSAITVAQVWDYLTATILTPGSIGKLLVDNIDTKLSDLPTLFWSKVIDGTYTADKVLKIMASILAGKTVIVDTGNNTAIVTFRNLDDTGDVVKANMNNSERITMTLTP